MTFSKGDHVAWNTPQGRTTGTVVERRTSDFEFSGQTFTASEDDPAFVVESDTSGKKAAHKGDALSATKD